jgi:preprotein translocase subunit SecD
LEIVATLSPSRSISTRGRRRIDDSIVSAHYIGLHDPPDGPDGVQISGDLTPQMARELAAILHTGPLPAALSPTG